MKKISVLGIIGAIVSLVAALVMTILCMQEASVVMQNFHMIINFLLVIISLALVIMFGIKRNVKVVVILLNVISILLTVFNVYSISDYMYLLDNPYIGTFPFFVVGLVLIVGNILSASSVFEK